MYGASCLGRRLLYVPPFPFDPSDHFRISTTFFTLEDCQSSLGASSVFMPTIPYSTRLLSSSSCISRSSARSFWPLQPCVLGVLFAKHDLTSRGFVEVHNRCRRLVITDQALKESMETPERSISIRGSLSFHHHQALALSFISTNGSQTSHVCSPPFLSRQ